MKATRKIAVLTCIILLLGIIPNVGSQANEQRQSYLTGQSKNAGVANRRPFALVVANNKAALPQYGISAASVYYEAPVEGAMTRLVVVVEDYDNLPRIGPVRSARDYHVYEAMGRQAIFAHWGLAVPYCADLINGPSVDNISAAVRGISRGASEAFTRVSRPGKALEFTGYMTIDGYNRAVDRLGYAKNYSSDFVPQFAFAGERLSYSNAPGATVIRPGGTSRNRSGYGNGNPYFTYNADDQLYYRFQYGGRHIDEMNNQQLTVTNVIYQYTNGEARDANGYLRFDILGSGTARIFTSGRMIEGTWRRDSETSPARYYDAAGNQIQLNQGKTWICLIWNSYAEFAVWE